MTAKDNSWGYTTVVAEGLVMDAARLEAGGLALEAGLEPVGACAARPTGAAAAAGAAGPVVAACKKGEGAGAAPEEALPKGDPCAAAFPKGLGAGPGPELAAPKGEPCPAAKGGAATEIGAGAEPPSMGPELPRDPLETRNGVAPKGELDLAADPEGEGPQMGVPHLEQATWISALLAEHRWQRQWPGGGGPVGLES